MLVRLFIPYLIDYRRHTIVCEKLIFCHPISFADIQMQDYYEQIQKMTDELSALIQEIDEVLGTPKPKPEPTPVPVSTVPYILPARKRGRPTKESKEKREALQQILYAEKAAQRLVRPMRKFKQIASA